MKSKLNSKKKLESFPRKKTTNPRDLNHSNLQTKFKYKY